MIISHKYKFIFIKTRKTAGTSVEIGLSKFCGKKDIITPIFPEDEKTRQGLGYIGPQNCYLPFKKYALGDWLALFKNGKRKLLFYNHISAREIRSLIDEEVWNSYYKFCFERNPWDKVISLYYFRHSRLFKSQPWPTISEFIQSQPVDVSTDFDLYTIDGKIVVDKVGLYENLKQELAEIANHLNLPEKISLPYSKSGYRRDKRHYREILNEEDKEKISMIFAREIEYFGYKY